MVYSKKYIKQISTQTSQFFHKPQVPVNGVHHARRKVLAGETVAAVDHLQDSKAQVLSAPSFTHLPSSDPEIQGDHLWG